MSIVVTEEPSAGSPHQSPRRVPISAIVIHDTGGKTAASALSWFAYPTSTVSAHVVIDRDGRIYRVVPDAQKAWHAGVSVLHGVANVNNYSLGVELVDNDDSDPYPDAQLNAAALWCARAAKLYRIPLNRIVGHDAICVPYGRKVDPGRDFPWVVFLDAVAQLIRLS